MIKTKYTTILFLFFCVCAAYGQSEINVKRLGSKSLNLKRGETVEVVPDNGSSMLIDGKYFANYMYYTLDGQVVDTIEVISHEVENSFDTVYFVNALMMEEHLLIFHNIPADSLYSFKTNYVNLENPNQNKSYYLFGYEDLYDNMVSYVTSYDMNKNLLLFFSNRYRDSNSDGINEFVEFNKRKEEFVGKNVIYLDTMHVDKQNMDVIAAEMKSGNITKIREALIPYIGKKNVAGILDCLFFYFVVVKDFEKYSFFKVDPLNGRIDKVKLEGDRYFR